MKKYQIIKNGNLYGVASKEDIKEYKDRHFLPVEFFMKKKNELIFVIENNKRYEKFNNNTDYKTEYIY